MSTQNQNPKQEVKARRDEEARLSAGHLAQPTAGRDEDDDWGDVPVPKKTTVTPPPVQNRPFESENILKNEDLAEEDLERELSGKTENDEDEDEDENMTVSTSAPAVQQSVQPSRFDANDALLQIEQLQHNLPALTQALESKLSDINTRRAKLDEEEKDVKKQINLLRTLSGQTPLENEDEDFPRRRPYRRRQQSGTTPASAPQTVPTPAPEAENRPRQGRRGRRFHNDQTLKEAICSALLRMTHPTKGTPYTGFVNDITQEVIQKEGYKSTSAKPTNTVRIQMYRLEDEGRVRQNEDNSYTLRKSAVRELGGNEQIAN